MGEPVSGRPGGMRYVRILFFAVVMAFTLKVFVVDAVTVPSRSMEPAVLPGDCLIIDKTGYSPPFLASRLPDRGDVIAFVLPPAAGEGDGAIGLKRCIAVAGDTIEYRNGSILVNGAVALRGVTDPGAILAGGAPRVVPRAPVRPEGRPVGADGEDSLFVVGDNHDVSLDSRAWGFIPARSVVGKAAMVYWSRADDGDVRWSRIGTLVR